MENGGRNVRRTVSTRRAAHLRSARRKKRRRRRLLGLTLMCFAAAAALWLVLAGAKQPADGAVQQMAQSTLPENAGTTEPEAQDGAWQLVLVNRDHPLPDDLTVETVQLSNGEEVDARIYPALQEMFDEMRAQGLYPVVASGYRTRETQQRILDDKITAYCSEGYPYEQAKALAEEWVALPGTSEHELGLAVDINADNVNSTGQEVYDWLLQNAWRYGFIQRYPADKTDITGISNEPWHYRYVGLEAAEEITQQGICLEEYLGA